MSDARFRGHVRPPSPTLRAAHYRSAALLRSPDGTSYIVALIVVAAVALLAAILRSDKMQGLGLLALERTRRLQRGFGRVGEKDVGNGNDPKHALRRLLNDHEHNDDQDSDFLVEGSSYTYPGLLNTSTTCYLNSTLQALASCPSFLAYLRAILSSTDTHLEFTSALFLLLNRLNSGSFSASVIRTDSIVYSLINSSSASNASRNRRRIMQGAGQQDAQEFYLILAETVEEEKKLVFEELQKRKNATVGFRQLLLPSDLLQALTRIVRRISLVQFDHKLTRFYQLGLG